MGICSKEINNQKLILNVPPTTAEQLNTISLQIKNNVVFKIFGNNRSVGTGFFCNIRYIEQEIFLSVLITNNHILNREDLTNGQIIKLTFDNDKIIKIITIDESRITYTNESLDITIIEVVPDIDNIYINNFLEIDENIFSENTNQIYSQKPIYIMQYPKGEKQSFSLGIVKTIYENEINHLCSTEPGSSGSPILNLLNFKVIGVHKGSEYGQDINLGIYFKYIIEDFKKIHPILKNKNEKKFVNIIKYTIENDIENYDSDKSEINVFHTNSDINSSTTELYVNEEKCEFGLFPSIKVEKGIYQIKLIINKVITDCNHLFCDCSNIISIDLSSLDTKQVTNMYGMFIGCKKLKNINFTNFDTKKVTNMKCMFSGCNNLDEINLSSFNTENVENMNSMFYDCHILEKIIFPSSFSTKNVNIMSQMFLNCKKLKSLDLSSFDFQNVFNFREMFSRCKALEEIEILKFNASKGKTFSGMFKECENLKKLKSIETVNAIDMEKMFFSCKSLTELDLSSFNTNNVKYMNSMFESCEGLKTLDLSSFNTSNVEEMERMFKNCINLETINLSSFDTAKVVTMESMFENCKDVERLNLSSFNTTKVVSMKSMFENCKKLISLDLSSFNTDNIKSTYEMFRNCGKFKIKDFPNIKVCGSSVINLKTLKSYN